ncbi:MAG: CPBP family intramembrane metalloprotease [Acidobacteriota bacterium]|nr:CPBP family intramembrane metalloprotease [Acidobacteriota bacterium]
MDTQDLELDQPNIEPGQANVQVGTTHAEPTRTSALIEVLVCSGFPTQIAIMGLLHVIGMRPGGGAAGLSLPFFAALALADSILLVGLILFFLRSHDESPRAIFLGVRPVKGEAALGLVLVPVVFIFVALIVGSLRLLAPWLHTVPQNPLGALLDTPGEAVIFAFVVIIAGGLREEVQRAFILHRFEQSLGGAKLGLVLFSAMFGLGHIEQGADIAIATSALGLFWGVLYLARRSIAAPAVSHAGFNLTQVIVQATLKGATTV